MTTELDELDKRIRWGWPEAEILSKDMDRVRKDAIDAADAIRVLRRERDAARAELADIQQAWDDHVKASAALALDDLSPSPGLRQAAEALSNFAWSSVSADCSEARDYLSKLVRDLRAALKD